MPIRTALLSPPITEALVDLRAVPTRRLDPRAVRSAIGDRYPAMKETWNVEAGLRLEKGKDPVPFGLDKGLDGYYCTSTDGREIVQFRVNGFTYNRLRPYTNGDAVIAEALRVWKAYVDIAEPADVTRIALRYINHLTFPAGDSLATFLRDAAPAVPEGASGEVDSFLNRVQSRDGSNGCTVIRTIASTPRPPDAKEWGVIIDIDAFKIEHLATDAAVLVPVLGDLRALKNDVFFGSITPATVELLNEQR